RPPGDRGGPPPPRRQPQPQGARGEPPRFPRAETAHLMKTRQMLEEPGEDEEHGERQTLGLGGGGERRGTPDLQIRLAAGRGEERRHGREESQGDHPVGGGGHEMADAESPRPGGPPPPPPPPAG